MTVRIAAKKGVVAVHGTSSIVQFAELKKARHFTNKDGKKTVVFCVKILESYKTKYVHGKERLN